MNIIGIGGSVYKPKPGDRCDTCKIKYLCYSHGEMSIADMSDGAWLEFLKHCVWIKNGEKLSECSTVR